MKTPEPARYEFGPFRFEPAKSKLCSGGEVIPLVPKAVELLSVLIRHRGRVLRKEELIELLWPDTNVTEANLSQTIYLLRKALGDTSDAARYIETVPRQGYHFAAEVLEIYEEAPEEGGGRAGAAGPGGGPELPRTETWAAAAAPAPPAPGPRAARFGAGLRGASARWAFVGVAAVLIAAGAVSLSRRQERPGRAAAPAPRDINSLAVLPFKNIGAASAEGQLGLGIADIVINKLSRLKRLAVRPTSAVFRYTDKDYDSLAAGRELRVDAVLDGSVHRDAGRVRVSLRLVSVSDGRALWAEVFDEDFHDIFKVQDVIAQRTALALGREFNKEAVRPPHGHTASVEAYQSYVRGLYFWSKRSSEGLTKSVEYFEDAVRRDPEYAAAYAGLADALALLGLDTYEPARRAELFEKARGTLLRVKQLRGDLPEAFAAHFLVKYYHDRDPEAAEEEIRQAVALDDYALAHLRYGFFFRDRGDMGRAAVEFRRALELDPVSWMGSVALCEVLWLGGDYEGALEHARRAVEVEPRLRAGPLHLAFVYTAMKKYDEAIAVLSELPAEGIGPSVIAGDLGYACAMAGRVEEANRLLVTLLETAEEVPGKQFDIALIYTALGDKESALRHLGSERKEMPHLLNALRFDPRLAPLRPDPRFRELLRKHAEVARP